MWPGYDSRTRRHMWAEFIVGSLLCSEKFYSGYSDFPLSLKTNISKFQSDPGMHGHFKRVIVNFWCSVGKQITLQNYITLNACRDLKVTKDPEFRENFIESRTISRIIEKRNFMTLLSPENLQQ